MTLIDKSVLKQMLENTNRKDLGLPIQSPLNIANPTLIDELFSRIDLAHKNLQIPTESDIETVAAYYRAKRIEFAQLQAEGKIPRGPKPKAKLPPGPIVVEY